MKKIIISICLIFFSCIAFSQNYSYIRSFKSGAALYQYDTIVSPVGTDTTVSFEGYFENPYTIFIDFRSIDANDSQVDVGIRGLNMDTIFMSLDTALFPITVDTAKYTQKVVAFKSSSCYSPELLIKYTKGSASAGLKFPTQIFCPK